MEEKHFSSETLGHKFWLNTLVNGSTTQILFTSHQLTDRLRVNYFFLTNRKTHSIYATLTITHYKYVKLPQNSRTIVVSQDKETFSLPEMLLWGICF